MGCQHVDHKHIAEFDRGRVNLPRDKAKEYRAQDIHLLVRVTQFCHLFLACPLVMAVLLGQKLNTFSKCVLYEHHANKSPSYIQVHTFNPSNLSTTSDYP